MKSRRDLDLECYNANWRTSPSYIHILPCVKVSSGLNQYFLSYRVHRQTDTDTVHTDRYEHCIVAVDRT